MFQLAIEQRSCDRTMAVKWVLLLCLLVASSMSAVVTAITVSSAIECGTDWLGAFGACGQVVQSYLRLHVWYGQGALSLNNLARVLGLPVQFTSVAESQALTYTALILVGGAVGAATEVESISTPDNAPAADAGMISDQHRSGLCDA